jgi:hypothetical protein
MSDKEKLKKGGWTAAPEGVWFGVDYAESHKTNVLDILTDLLDLDPNVEGYDFLVSAYKKGEVE